LDITSVQIPVLIGALLFSCSALLQVHVMQRLAGSSIVPAQWAGAGPGELAVLSGLSAEAAPASEQSITRPAPRAGRQPRPRTSPSDWAEQDAEVRHVVAMAPKSGTAYRGPAACDCGGEWRYDLCRRSAELWRCLHCGGLHSGQELVPEFSAT
jgi:hypothetical protein